MKNKLEYLKYFENFYNKTLNNYIWKDDVIDEKLREKLLTIAYEFFNSLKLNKTEFPNIKENVEIKDIILTGSLANYNYNENSDFDLHILIDFNDINENYEIVKNMLDSKRFIWNLNHQITIKGYDIEVYVQDINEEHNSTGQYSLLNNEWLVKPVHKEPVVKEKEIEKVYSIIHEKIISLENLKTNNINPEKAVKYNNYSKKLFKKIMTMRRNSLKEYGEFSIGNLTFKKLRNSGDIKILKDLINFFYDKIYTQ